MGLLDRFLHRAPDAKPAVTEETPACLHVALVPRWDDIAAMGQEEKASSYRCDSCGQEFTPAEAQAVRAQAAERLHDLSEEAPSAN